jgi:type I restriction enzyme M protein
VARSVDYSEISSENNNFNLSVSSYVQSKDTREVVDILKLNQEIKTTVEKINRLRTDIDAIIAEIEA